MRAVEKLKNIQEKNKSIICLGLDLDAKKMPLEYTKSTKTMYEFVKKILNATSDLVCAYKPNLAFYEEKGPEGISLLRSVIEKIPRDITVILDGKRGDIGNTASFYAKSSFEKLKADWVTLNPYMGYDSMRPFLEYKDKGVFVLCLTSNAGAKDFQLLSVDGKPLYQIVAEKVDYWNKEGNCGLVVGATQPEQLKGLRDIAGSMPLLIPGVGAQGGSLEKAALYGTDNFQKLAVINVCRSVLYASSGGDFAQRAREELIKLNDIINQLRYGESDVEKENQAVPPQNSDNQPPPLSNAQSSSDTQSANSYTNDSNQNQKPDSHYNNDDRNNNYHHKNRNYDSDHNKQWGRNK
ncbi:MAG: orotidine-5'-phosphate decarboxylase [FCB group bacterium]|nr:orotidine-5'-phosphate decarboxylase [FCB group bacterium]